MEIQDKNDPKKDSTLNSISENKNIPKENKIKSIDTNNQKITKDLLMQNLESPITKRIIKNF